MRRGPATTALVAVLLVLAGCVSAAGPLGDETLDATVIDVIDGDTLEVRLADGRSDRVRLLGVDTPEVYVENEPGEFEGVPNTTAGAECLRAAGHNATAFMRRQVLDASVTLVVDSLADRRDDYGRLLAYVRVEGQDVNRRLLVEGQARLYDSEFTRSASFAEAETTAQAERRGLWRCRDPTDADTAAGDGPLRLDDIHADADGDDRGNLNDEYLVFENTADRTLDLTGWTLEDAAGHTYRFPEGFALEPGERVTVFTGDGNDSATALYWSANRPVWNNDGDSVLVRSSNGTVVLERTYS